MTTTHPLFDRAWQKWIAENLMKGVSAVKLVDRMVERGFDREFALRQVTEFEQSPSVEAGRSVFSAQRKALSLLDTMAELCRQSEHARKPLKRTITADDFYEQYYYRNLPVVVQGLMTDWPALTKWTPEYFAERYGDEVIEITDHRDSDRFFEDNFVKHRSTITMREYVRRLHDSGTTNDLYVVAKNGLLANPAFRDLYRDIDCPPGFLDARNTANGNIKLWFGPAGTLTPLHHDGSNIFFAQVRGKKRVKLIHPSFLNYLYNDRTCFSQVDLAQIDYDKFPLMRAVEIYDVVLEPNELLLIPVGWWHWVQSLEISISLSFHNFFFRGNPIVWRH